MNKRIKKLRKCLDLTQQEFAEKIGVKRNTVATYEMGRSEPSDAAISLICREFNVNENWLRNNEEPMFNQQSKKEELTYAIEKFLSNESNSFKERLISILIRLDESDWEVLEKIAIKIFNDKNNYHNELSVTNEISATQAEPEDIPTEYKNMSVEEMINQANMWEALIQKKRAEKLSTSQEQKENMKNQMNNTAN